jgi:hypothetical protein
LAIYLRNEAYRLSYRSQRSRSNQLIDQRRRRFAARKVRLYGSDRNLCEYERGASELHRPSSTEYTACKTCQAGLEPLRLIAHATSESCKPISLHEIVTAVEQE